MIEEDDDTAVNVLSAVLTLLRFITSGHDTRRRLRRTIREDKSATRTDPSEAAQEGFCSCGSAGEGEDQSIESECRGFDFFYQLQSLIYTLISLKINNQKVPAINSKSWQKIIRMINGANQTKQKGRRKRTPKISNLCGARVQINPQQLLMSDHPEPVPL